MPIPQPRSYPQIVGAIQDKLMSKLELTSLAVGNPLLRLIEACAQSDLRSSQDFFSLLASLALDTAEKSDLDNIGRDEGVPRIPKTAANGVVVISDTSFSRIASRVYQGAAAPVVGSTTVFVEDGSSFPATGSVYLGRGTTNSEGPIAYSSIVNGGSYWTLTLSAATQRFHQLGESIVVAQGGDRTVGAGTSITTPKATGSTVVEFQTTQASVLPDGENQIFNVPVRATLPGKVGNVIAGGLNTFASLPFAGATVSNATAYTTGLEVETDESYRDRIRLARKSRAKATIDALTFGLVGLNAPIENQTITSASVVRYADSPTTAYIDTGLGYEETAIGIPYETIIDSALGGERNFELAQGRPMAKAFVWSEVAAPYALADGMQLSFNVGGDTTTHDFASAAFSDISRASAFEVVSAINSNPVLGWEARTIENGSKFAIQAKSDTQEDLQNVVPSGVDANSVFGFATSKAQTLFLYKNDRILNKDGLEAKVLSRSKGDWATVNTSNLSFTYYLDESESQLQVTISAQDFINANTGFTEVSSGNSLEAWAKVLTKVLYGVTVSVEGDKLAIVSNRGRATGARVAVLECDFTNFNFFPITSSVGAPSDYVLDRNLGQISLNVGLEAGDRLTAGSVATRAFIESEPFSSITLTDDAELWFVVDGATSLVQTGVSTNSLVNVALASSTANIDRVSYTVTNALANVLEGDWLIATDSAFSADNLGAFRVLRVDDSQVTVPQPLPWAATENPLLNNGGLYFVRTEQYLQKVVVPGSTTPYTATSLAAVIQDQLVGATAAPYRTRSVRIRTNTFGLDGDIALVAWNATGATLGFALGVQTNDLPHYSTITANPDTGTPSFANNKVTTVTSTTQFNFTGSLPPDRLVVGLERFENAGASAEYDSNIEFASPLEVVSATATARRPVIKQWLVDDRFYAASPYALTARDSLGLTLDSDPVSKRFVFNTYRKVLPGSSTYGLTNDFKDADNGNATLAKSFGTAFEWNDFAVHMQARVKSHPATANKTALWRYYRHGPDGNAATMQYDYPTTPSASIELSSETPTTGGVKTRVTLGSGAAKTYTIRDSSKIGVAIPSTTSGLYDYTYIFNLDAASATRVLALDYTGRGTTAFSGTLTGVTSGATATIVSDSLAGGLTGSGTLVLTGIVGTFVNGEVVNGTAGSASAYGPQYGRTTLTLTLPTGILNHGFSVDNVVWLASTNINFASGPKSIVAVPAGNTITYKDVAVAVGPVANIGTVSFDTLGEVTLNGSTVVAGDIFSIQDGTSLPVASTNTVKTLTKTNGYVTAQYPTSTGLATIIEWGAVNDSDFAQFYSLSANTVSSIVTAVNALGGVLTGTLLGSGAGTVTNATYELAEGVAAGFYQLTDGINWVRSHTTPGSTAIDTGFTFKQAVTASLASNSDWENEDVRLVPITADNIQAFFSVGAIGGLFAASEIAVSTQGRRPQITSTTIGSSGLVDVDSGTANSFAVGILETAERLGTAYAKVVVDSDSVDGLAGGQWVEIKNAQTCQRVTLPDGLIVDSLDADGTLVVTGTELWEKVAFTNDMVSKVEKQGEYVAYTGLVVGEGPTGAYVGVSAGDSIYFGTAYNAGNQGYYTVVRVSASNDVVWVKNPHFVPENVASTSFAAYNSTKVLIGDKFVINTTLLGDDNKGEWTVVAYGADEFSVVFDTNLRSPTPVTSINLGTDAALVQIREPAPSSRVFQVYAVSPNTLADRADVQFECQKDRQISFVGAFAGSTIHVLDKLGFGIDPDTYGLAALHRGVDGYMHSTGLLEEANKTLYGSPSDPISYPGLVAGGDKVNLRGALIKRLKVSVAVRQTQGITVTDVINRIKSAVAGVVNSNPVSNPIAISDIVTAVNSINGVTSIAVVFPDYSAASDQIRLGNGEKGLIVDLDDVTVTFLGD